MHRQHLTRCIPRITGLFLMFAGCMLSAAHASATNIAREQHVFPNSGSEEAQTSFQQGLFWLHNFEYEDAIEEFQKAQRIDPDFAMAYWGEAMAHNQPVWLTQDLDAARASLLKLGPTRQARIDQAKTEREKQYVAAADVLFFGSDDKYQRDKEYMLAMRELVRTFPDDIDAVAFYALSKLGTSHGGRDFALYMQSAAELQRALKQAPDHPGLLHYFIHSVDDPVHAPLGLDAAGLYSEVAPESSHALHMPTHIYFSLGMWEESNRLNERSLAASRDRAARKKIPLDVHGVHSLRWLLYGYLQAGREKEARALLMRAEEDHKQGDLESGPLIYLDAIDLLETEQWGRSLRDLAVPSRIKISRNRTIQYFARAMQAIRTGQPDIARAMLENMQQELEEMQAQDVKADGNRILLLEVKALLALQDDDRDTAFRLLDKAAGIEDAMPFAYGPAWPVKPVHELYGDVLYRLGDAEQACRQYETSQARFPNRRLTLQGALRCYTSLQDEAKLRETQRRLDAGKP